MKDKRIIYAVQMLSLHIDNAITQIGVLREHGMDIQNMPGEIYKAREALHSARAEMDEYLARIGGAQ